MAGIVPNIGSTYARQAVLDTVDLEIVQGGSNLTGVVSGCATTTAGGVMTVAVASGVVRVAGRPATYSTATSSAMTSHASLPKWYLITINNAGALNAPTAGTAAADPKIPAIPSNSVVVAAVYLPANVSAITSGMIVDKRVTVPTAVYFDPHWYGAVADGVTDDSTAIQAAIDAADGADGGIVQFRSGLFGVGASLTHRYGVTLKGVGSGQSTAGGQPGTSLVALATLADYVIKGSSVGAASNTYQHHSAVYDLRIDGNDQTAGGGMRYGAVGENFTIDRVFIAGCYSHGILMEQNNLTGSTPLHLGKLSLHGNGRGGTGSGIHLDGQNQTAVVLEWVGGDNNKDSLIEITSVSTYCNTYIGNIKCERWNAAPDTQPYVVLVNSGNNGSVIVGSGRVHTTLVYTGAEAQTAIFKSKTSKCRFVVTGGITWADGETGAFDYFVHQSDGTSVALTAYRNRSVNESGFSGGSFISASESYNGSPQAGPPVYLGAYALWVDGSGRLRIKSGAPSSSTDGTVVGTQS